jgi:putative membrane protein
MANDPNPHALPDSPAQPFARSRSLGGYLAVAARGFCMGSADVVPGVSGGTMAFILGIYEELVESIRMGGRPVFWRALAGLDLREALRLVNFPFLAWLAAGIVSAILVLAPGIEWTLVNQPVLIWSFFFGLVLASVFVVSRRIPDWTPALWAALGLGTLGAYVLVGLVPVETPTAAWFLFLSGAIAICAMILPGISGSFILVLLGKYQYMVAAVNSRDVITIFWAGLGAAVGIVTFAQLLGWLFRRYHDLTVALLTGFMLGSLRKVWPWKETVAFIVDRHGAILPTVERNVLPALGVEVGYAVMVALVGLTAVWVLDRVANREQTV